MLCSKTPFPPPLTVPTSQSKGKAPFCGILRKNYLCGLTNFFLFASAIAVHVQHSQCIFFAGTFEPAYTVTVSALPSYVLPATNQRNAFVLSEHLEEALGVPKARGFISFVPIPEENVACNGKTVAAALDETLVDPSGYAMGVIEEENTTKFGSRRKRLSVKVRSPCH